MQNLGICPVGTSLEMGRSQGCGTETGTLWSRWDQVDYTEKNSSIQGEVVWHELART